MEISSKQVSGDRVCVVCPSASDQSVRPLLRPELTEMFGQRRAISKAYSIIFNILIDVSRFVPNKKTLLRSVRTLHRHF